MSTPAGQLPTIKAHHWVEFLRFGLVGGSGVLVNLVVFILASKLIPLDEHQILFGLWPTPKNFRAYHLMAMIAFLVANLWNFELNRVWTFKRGGKSSRQRFLRFFLVGLAAQIFGLAIMSLLLHPESPISLPRSILDGSSGFRTPKYWAQLIQVICTTPISFVLQKLWTFRGTGHRPDPEPAPADAENAHLS